jgi:hypothetical protein
MKNQRVQPADQRHFSSSRRSRQGLPAHEDRLRSEKIPRNTDSRG